jgi:hypothetical protein
MTMTKIQSTGKARVVRAHTASQGDTGIASQDAAAPVVQTPPTGLQASAAAARQTKRDRLVALLSRPEGATIAQMAEALGWLPHTTRAALTGLRKTGLMVASDKVGDQRIYRTGGQA